MRKIRAVLFDMDGLLVDSERPNLACCVEMARRMGFELDMLALARRVLGCPRSTVIDNYRASLPEHIDAAQFFHDKNALFLQWQTENGFQPMRGARELLTWLGEAGISRVIATSTPAEKAYTRLKSAGLTDLVDHVLTGDMVQNGKPHPECFLRAAALAQADPAQCLVLEDSCNGIRAGRAAGCIVGMVPDVVPYDETCAPYCDVVFDHLGQVIDWIKEA